MQLQLSVKLYHCVNKSHKGNRTETNKINANLLHSHICKLKQKKGLTAKKEALDLSKETFHNSYISVVSWPMVWSGLK